MLVILLIMDDVIYIGKSYWIGEIMEILGLLQYMKIEYMLQYSFVMVSRLI